jgi:hypothetical protein
MARLERFGLFSGARNAFCCSLLCTNSSSYYWPSTINTPVERMELIDMPSQVEWSTRLKAKPLSASGLPLIVVVVVVII